MGAAGLWDELATDWVCLDAEIMPWNAKAQGLLKEQYAPVAAAGRATLSAEADLLKKAAERSIENVSELLPRWERRLSELEAYRAAYAWYCWPVAGIGGLKAALNLAYQQPRASEK